MSESPEKLLKRANDKLNPGFFSKMFSSEESRLEEAASLFEQAANAFKIDKKWSEAGKAYEQCAKIEGKLRSNTAINHFQEASHCFSFVDKLKSKELLDECVKTCESTGKFQQAGRLMEDVAKDCEADLDYATAIEKYKKASELYAMESQNTRSLQQKCLLKVADLMCISNHKDMNVEAPKIYEKLGMQYLTVPLLKSSAKDVFFKNVVCYLAMKDEVTAEVQLKKFLNEDPTFDDSRESKFLFKVIECMTDPPNPEGFKVEVATYKKYRDLDKWKLNMFAEILKKLEICDNEDLK